MSDESKKIAHRQQLLKLDALRAHLERHCREENFPVKEGMPWGGWRETRKEK